MNHNSEHAVDGAGPARCAAWPAVASRTLRAGALALVLAGCSTALPAADNERALADIASHRSGAEEVVTGQVVRVLPNSHGPAGVHERFVVDVVAGASHLPLYVTDNISIAQAAPLRPGDLVTVKGELAYNDIGPLLHWTHRDPRMRHPPGFVEVGGHVYE